MLLAIPGLVKLQARLADLPAPHGKVSMVEVDVTDTGTGISPEALPHIFERFYQADPSRSGGEKHGTGLGLAIVKEIVGAHGGKISVRSTPKTGSTFTVSLPLATQDVTVDIRRNN